MYGLSFAYLDSAARSSNISSNIFETLRDGFQTCTAVFTYSQPYTFQDGLVNQLILLRTYNWYMGPPLLLISL